MNHKLSLVFILSLINLSQTQRNRGNDHNSNDYTNLSITRKIDLTQKILTITTTILAKSTKVDPIYSYRFPLLKNSTSTMVNIAAKMHSPANEEETIPLKINKAYSNQDDLFDYYEMNFRSEPMNYEEERVIVINEHYSEKLQMLPKMIGLKDDQLVLFIDTINHISYYNTLNHTTIVALPNEGTQLMYAYNYINPIVSILRRMLREAKI